MAYNNNNSHVHQSGLGAINFAYPSLFYFWELTMSYIPQQINALRRDINEIDYAIIRARKAGNTVKADNLMWKKSYMTDMLSDLNEPLTFV